MSGSVAGSPPCKKTSLASSRIYRTSNFTDVIVNTISNMSVMRRSADTNANKLPHKRNNGHKCISFLQHRHRYIISFMWQLVCCTSSHSTHFIDMVLHLCPKLLYNDEREREREGGREDELPVTSST